MSLRLIQTTQKAMIGVLLRELVGVVPMLQHDS